MRWFILLAFVVLFALLVVQESDGWWGRRRRTTTSSIRRRTSYTRQRTSYSSRRRRRRRVVCPSITCKNGGTRRCRGSYAYCRCRTGYHGSRCEKGCGYINCYNGGRKYCHSGWWNSRKVAKCRCPRGTRGKKCQHKIVVCPRITCNNGGTRRCHRGNASCRCRCGYYGRRCKKGCGCLSCYNGGRKYCHSGWWNSKKVAKCKCPRWFKGKYCGKKTCPKIHCRNGGRRICSRPGVAKCLCKRGFNGKDCGCGYIYCKNGGKLTCSGWLWGSKKAKCKCTRWFKGKYCEKKTCPKIHCRNGGRRICPRPGVAKCDCKRDFSGNKCGNGCKYKKCYNGGTKMCVKHLIFFTVPRCHCPIGFYGGDCKKTCPVFVCKNGGKTACTTHFWIFTFSHCICSSSCDKGSHCEIPKYPLLTSKECVNGKVVCMKKKFSCMCHHGYTGSRCDIRIKCHNGGKAGCKRIKDPSTGRWVYVPACQCPPFFSGPRCKNGCKRIKCHNGGKAGCKRIKDPSAGRWVHVPDCQCPPLFRGPRCKFGPMTTQAPTTKPSIIIKTHAPTPTQDPLLTVKQGKFTFEAEGDDNRNSSRFSRVLHVFSNTSGVTVGRGYDLKDKKPKQIKKDLVEAGINGTIADKLAVAAGLVGDKARKWIKDQKLEKFTITRKQQKILFEKEYARKANITKTTVEKYTNNKLKFKELNQVAQDIVIDIFYRGDYSMSNDFPKKKKLSIIMQKAFDLSKKKPRLTALYDLVKDFEFWVLNAKVDRARAKARFCYVYKSKPPPTNETGKDC